MGEALPTTGGGDSRARHRPLLAAALWPLGVGLTSWHYVWRTTPLHRRELPGTPEDDSPPPLPADVSHDGVQLPDDGVGALFHRCYRARIGDGRSSAEALMAQVRADPNRLAPSEFARFVKVRGDEGDMRVGDEYVVRMPGPWNGPVRVVSVTSTSLRLATLEGHLEAGQIEFRASEDGEDLMFTIESWASSGDRLSKLLYQHVRMAKEVQFHMWTSFLEHAARVCKGRLVGGIDVETRPLERPDGAGGRPLTDPRTKRLLDALHDKPLNFSLERRDWLLANESGWRIDAYRQPLPSEAPGAPVAGGTWEVARRLMCDYEFADPAIVRAVYYPDRPFQDRDMLLEARFWGLRFHLGVRVGGVIDETRVVDARKVRVWGWNYRTLQGHFEMGQIDYEVWKWLDTGAVEFRISAFSRPAEIRNPLVRIGFWLFGRHEQVKFARHACQRMARLTAAALAEGSAVNPCSAARRRSR